MTWHTYSSNDLLACRAFSFSGQALFLWCVVSYFCCLFLSFFLSFFQFCLVFQVIIAVVWFATFCAVTALHRVQLHSRHRFPKYCWGVWRGILWLLIVVEVCKCMVYFDILNRGIGFDLWEPEIFVNTESEPPTGGSVTFQFVWLLRGFDLAVDYPVFDNPESTQANAFKSGIWAQVVLVGFNLFRYIALDFTLHMTPPGARFVHRVLAFFIASLLATALVSRTQKQKK